TQAQLAAPEFSISYISAIERGKIRPSLKALSILARRLDVPLTFLLEGSPSGAAEARAVGYSPADSGPDQKIDVDLLQASVLVQQGAFEEAEQLLGPIQPERITTDQVYRLFLLRGQIHLGSNEFQEAVVDLRLAVTQAESLNDSEATERARNLLGRAYFMLYNYTLAVENHLRCNTAIENSQSYKAIGKLTMARDYAMRSLALYEMRDEQRLVGLTHQRLGKTLEKQNDLDEAEKEYRQAIAIEQELNDAVSASTCHTSLAELLLKRGKTEEAEKEAQEALTFARSSEDAQAHGQALIALAQLRHEAKDYAAADELFTEALDLLDSSQAHEIAASAYFRYANLLEERGEVQRSLNAIKKSFEHQ